MTLWLAQWMVGLAGLYVALGLLFARWFVTRGLASADESARDASGNLLSRFTDFLTTDGEKPWRDREAEFANVQYGRQQMNELWKQGWDALFNELKALSDDDLSTQVTIRGVPLTVHEALCRSLAHVAMHVGQIIVLARLLHQGEWQWLSRV